MISTYCKRQGVPAEHKFNLLIDLFKRHYVDFSVFANIKYDTKDTHGFDISADDLFKVSAVFPVSNFCFECETKLKYKFT